MILNGLSDQHIQKSTRLSHNYMIVEQSSPVCREVARLCLASLITVNYSRIYLSNSHNANPSSLSPILYNSIWIYRLCYSGVVQLAIAVGSSTPPYPAKSSYDPLGDRSMVGHRFLVPSIGVRLPIPQQ